jgi:hypothetical protein
LKARIEGDYRYINMNHPENETQIDQEDDGETIPDAGTGDSPNP